MPHRGVNAATAARLNAEKTALNAMTRPAPNALVTRVAAARPGTPPTLAAPTSSPMSVAVRLVSATRVGARTANDATPVALLTWTAVPTTSTTIDFVPAGAAAPGSAPRRELKGCDVRSCDAHDRLGATGTAGRHVERVSVDHQSLVEGVRRVDLHAVRGDDVVILEPDAADAGRAVVRLQIEDHALLQGGRSVLRRRTEERRLPRIRAGAVAEVVEDVRIGGGEDVGVRRAGTDDGGRVEQGVVDLLMDLALLLCRLDVATDVDPRHVAVVAVEAAADVDDDQVAVAHDPVGGEPAVRRGVRPGGHDVLALRPLTAERGHGVPRHGEHLALLDARLHESQCRVERRFGDDVCDPQALLLVLGLDLLGPHQDAVVAVDELRLCERLAQLLLQRRAPEVDADDLASQRPDLGLDLGGPALHPDRLTEVRPGLDLVLVHPGHALAAVDVVHRPQDRVAVLREDDDGVAEDERRSEVMPVAGQVAAVLRPEHEQQIDI